MTLHDPEGELDRPRNNPEHDPSDQALKINNTCRARENRFPAGRNDRNMEWQERFSQNNRDNFSTCTFSYNLTEKDPIVFKTSSQILIHFWVFVGSLFRECEEKTAGIYKYEISEFCLREWDLNTGK